VIAVIFELWAAEPDRYFELAAGLRIIATLSPPVDSRELYG
jgi:hypothetical protein